MGPGTQQGGITIAAFDFDKTLSTRDNGVPFFVRLVGRPKVARALAKALPHLARGGRNAVKERITREVFTGLSDDTIHATAATFATDVLAHHLRDDVIDRAEWHREQGHRRVIISASYACYVAPVAQALGFDAALATGLVVGADGMLTGALDGPNVRGMEKVHRLDTWFADERIDGTTVDLWAYGDSAGDDELLARADHPVRVERARISRAPIGE